MTILTRAHPLSPVKLRYAVIIALLLPIYKGLKACLTMLCAKRTRGMSRQQSGAHLERTVRG